MVLAQILESAMLICFGLSWPLNAYKSYQARTAAGSSWQFIGLITIGYVAGIAAKFAAGQVNWVLAVYFLNLAFLAVNWWVYFRNMRLDKERMAQEKLGEAKRATALASAAVTAGARAAAAASSLYEQTPATEIGNVVIATDGSAGSLDAAALAARVLDLKAAASVCLLSVARDGSAQATSDASEALARTGAVLDAAQVPYEKKTRTGVAATEIVSEVAAAKPELVVMGSRGLSGIREFVLGSVSREVTDKIGCPIMIVK